MTYEKINKIRSKDKIGTIAARLHLCFFLTLFVYQSTFFYKRISDIILYIVKSNIFCFFSVFPVFVTYLQKKCNRFMTDLG